MYKKCIVLVGVFSLSVLLASPALAGFVDVVVTSPDAPQGGLAVSLDVSPDEDVGSLAIGETFDHTQDSFNLNIAGATNNANSILSITKVVENTTGIDWIGYEIDLDPAGTATFVDNQPITPNSNKLALTSFAPTSLDFGNATVPNGQSVTFTFDVSVPAGDFSIDMSQSPVLIPEPSTLLMALLMAVGGTAAALRYRWG